MIISRDLGLRKRSTAVGVKLFGHFRGDADGDGIGRDVVSNKSENSNNGIFSLRHSWHYDTVADHLAVLFQGPLPPFPCDDQNPYTTTNPPVSLSLLINNLGKNI